MSQRQVAFRFSIASCAVWTRRSSSWLTLKRDGIRLSELLIRVLWITSARAYCKTGAQECESWRALVELLNTFIRSPHLGWVESTADNALNLLERRLTGSKRVFAFGAPYAVGRGVHDIHMNQGDPPGQFQPLDGIWQDGTTIIESARGVFSASDEIQDSDA